MIRALIAAALVVTALVAGACSSPEAVPGSDTGANHPATAATSTAASTLETTDWPTATPPADPRGTPAGQIPTPTQVDDTDPDQVAKAAVIALYTVDSRTDASPAGAYLRAAPWLTTKLAADLAATPPTGGTAWLTLAKHHGYTTVTDPTTSSEYGQPAGRDHVAYRTVTFTLKTTYRDGTNAPAAVPDTRYVRLTHTDGAWKVSGLIS